MGSSRNVTSKSQRPVCPQTSYLVPQFLVGYTVFVKQYNSGAGDTVYKRASGYKAEYIYIAFELLIEVAVVIALKFPGIPHDPPPQAEGGHVIVEAKLADTLGISRTPLREALQRLEGEGLIRKGDGHN
ncbi:MULTISPECIES: GntR family transcriptional regulator [unclassified Rhizobium]|uniref:GntR family transcriptional regulator n=1 Tax=unclassified Rhizobium TaxID=2613769 RepID=UPI0017EFE348|nr:GntR family transcriptional regulator [Rhizobium sp. UBA1881]